MTVRKNSVRQNVHGSLAPCTACGDRSVSNHELRPCVFLVLGESRVGFKAAAAPRFIHSAGAHDDQLFAFHKSLRVHSRIATAHANGEQLGNFFSNSEKPWHGFERTAAIVGVESGYDDALSEIGEFGAYVHDL